MNPLISIGQKYRELAHVRKYYAALQSPALAQEKKLLHIIANNQDSKFGRKHRFQKIRSIADFQKAVPPAQYEDLAPYIEAAMRGDAKQLTAESPLMFATTSGTTNKPKFIPVTAAHLKDYTHAFQIHNWAMVRDYAHTAHARQARFLTFASNDLEGYTEAGIPYGAISGLLRRKQSRLMQKYLSLPHAVCRIKDVQSKYYTILRLALNHNVVAILSCNPSTLLLLSDCLQETADLLLKDLADGSFHQSFRPEASIYKELCSEFEANPAAAGRLAKILEHKKTLLPQDIWPELGLISCWKGGPMPFYLDRLPERYGPVPVRDFGYMASEGRGTIPLATDGASGPLALTSHFFEFVPEEEAGKAEPTYLTADQLEINKRYYIYFTTAAGLYRYNINDLMEVTGKRFNCPELRFVQKGAGISSITGEKLTEEQVHRAVNHALKQSGLTRLKHFTLAVEMDLPPYYTAFIELSSPVPDAVLQEFLRRFEDSLQAQNMEYREKRLSLRLAAPRLETLSAGTFTRIRQMRVAQGAPEAQVKIPFLALGGNFKQMLAALPSQP